MAGVSVGSFLNVVSDRIPHGRSLVRPKSFCENCDRPLASIDMVPVLSYLWLRGRCRSCQAPIPLRVMLVELATGALFTIVFLKFGFGMDFIVLCAAISLMVVVTLVDLEHGLILNSVVLPSLIVLILLAPFWSELGIDRGFLGSYSLASSLANSLLAGIGAFLIFLVIAMISPGGMGGGDVKFAGVLGLLLGFPGVLLAFWISVVTGGLIAVALLLARKKGRKDSIPFGPFMALGATVILIGGDNVVDWYRHLTGALPGAGT